MDVLFFLLPIALLLGLVGLVGMLWAARSGQFEDLDGPAHRILYDDDQAMIPGSPKPTDEPRPDDPKLASGEKSGEGGA